MGGIMTGKNSPFTRNSNSFPIMVIFVVVLLAGSQVQVVNCQTRNEPVNCNWIFSLPWDVANTLRAPFGGPVSLLLTIVAAAAMLLGLLLAPVHYILGYPPRIYHSYRQPGILGRSFDSDSTSQFFYGGGGGAPGAGGNYSHYRPTNNNNEEVYDESFDMADILVHLFQRVSSTFQVVFDRDEDYVSREGEHFTGRELTVVKADEGEYEPPGFLDSIFLLVPEEDEICRQLMVCHAHGFLEFLPKTMVKLYKMLSKHFITIPDNYKDAIKLGFEDQGECQRVYQDCPKGLFHLTRGSVGVIRQKLVHLLPEGTKDLWQSFYSTYY